MTDKRWHLITIALVALVGHVVVIEPSGTVMKGVYGLAFLTVAFICIYGTVVSDDA